MNKITTLGIDLAKNVFQLHGVDAFGKVVLRRTVRRAQLMQVIAQLPACLIGMEACGGANYWARRFSEHAHEVKMMSPQFVLPYRKSDKNDHNDAEAICEALSRPTMRLVAVKSIEQQDMQSLHRVPLAVSPFALRSVQRDDLHKGFDSVSAGLSGSRNAKEVPRCARLSLVPHLRYARKLLFFRSLAVVTRCV